jgi:dTDP-4-amino-4,6-dideoxygalactose transaminase
MKNLKTTLIVLFISLFVNTISAQKQSVLINQKTVRTNSNTDVKIMFDVDQLTSAAAVETLRAKLAGFTGVKKVVATPAAGNKSTFVMTFPTTFKLQNLQDALLAAGLNDVIVNNMDQVKTAQLVDHFKKK